MNLHIKQPADENSEMSAFIVVLGCGNKLWECIKRKKLRLKLNVLIKKELVIQVITFYEWMDHCGKLPKFDTDHSF